MTPIGEALVNRTWRQMHNRKIGHLRFFVVAILAASAAAPVALSQSADRPTVIDFRGLLSIGRSRISASDCGAIHRACKDAEVGTELWRS
jgi:hypothetical protein